MEVSGSAAGLRARWQWPLREVGAVRCQAASADLPGLDGGAVIPASGRQLQVAARSRWSLASFHLRVWRRSAWPQVICDRRSGKGLLVVLVVGEGVGTLLSLPSSSNSSDSERAVPVASWMPAWAAAPTARWQVKAAWCSTSASTTFGMFAVSVSPTCGVPGVEAACWLGAAHSRAMRPPTMAAAR